MGKQIYSCIADLILVTACSRNANNVLTRNTTVFSLFQMLHVS